MNKLLLVIGVAGLMLASDVQAQNSTSTDFLGLGNFGNSVEQGILNSGLLNASNYAGIAYMTYSPSTKTKVGAGALAAFDFPAVSGTNGAVGLALGMDWLEHWSMVSGNVTLKLETHPFKIPLLSFLPTTIQNISAEPIGVIGVGQPLSGGGQGAATLWDVGYNFKFGHLWGGQFGAGFTWGEWMNAGSASGHRYHVFVNWRKGF